MKSSLIRKSPAKINLFLAITGTRSDGFHELLSLMAPIEFSDTLKAKYSATTTIDTLTCSTEGVPTDSSNLVLMAAAAFRKLHPYPGAFHFTLEKQVPAGSGLGGGSSNGVAALQMLQDFFAKPLTDQQLHNIATKLGSDCPLFLKQGPQLIRGRGEILENISESAKAQLSGLPILLFRPTFSISTPWAFQQMRDAKNGHYYLAQSEAEHQLLSWLQKPSIHTLPLINNLQNVVFKKHLALPTLINQLIQKFNVKCMMSGSGSACFAIIEKKNTVQGMKNMIQQAFGKEALIVETRIA